MDGILVVRYIVCGDSLDLFDVWKSKMEAVIKTFKGYKNTIDLRATDTDDFHYMILRFDSTENAEKWMRSDYRRIMLEDLNVHWMSAKEEAIHEWDTFWFSKLNKTKKWKQWAVTLLAVYPLTVTIPLLVNGVTLFVPLCFLEGIIRAVLISGCMTFFVMPFILKLFKKWLLK